MRVVRCDACGAKAMIAAGQCPKCGHKFELRDGFGDLLPLAYCSSCASYYPETVGSCRWCGTMPERPPIWPQVLRGSAVAAAIAIVGTGWLLHDKQPARPRKEPAVKMASAPPKADAVVPRPVNAPIDSVVTRPEVVATTDNAARDTVSMNATPTPTLPQPLTPTAEVAAVEAKPPATKPAEKASSTTRQTRRWVRSVSRDWVVVRASASKQSRIVASIGPRSRVELGESVGSWRRIRAKGLNGWVEPRNSFELLASR